MNAQSVFDAAMSPGREPRSAAYRAGLLHCLRVRIDRVHWVRCPYAPGSAEFDAYYAGVDEGRALAPINHSLLDFDCADETPIAMRL